MFSDAGFVKFLRDGQVCIAFDIRYVRFWPSMKKTAITVHQPRKSV